MKGQAEIVVFILLFVIGLSLFIISTFWSRNIFKQNTDLAKIELARKTLIDLDKNIKDLIKFGGSRNIDYNLDGTIELIDDPEHNKIEIKTEVSINLPEKWVNLTTDSSYIREKLEGNILRIQLIYPESSYKVEFFTEGPKLAKPETIRIEKNSTYVVDSTTVIKIKVAFI
ncbi:MAG: hypothetical protein ACTSVB_11325 [Candidatus Heimdallarchaeaceae archaeon]